MRTPEGTNAWDVCVRLMRGQHGLACREQLIEAGLSARTLSRRLRTGALEPINPRVVSLPLLTPDLAVQTRAALMARPDTVPTGLSSATFLGRGPWDEVPLLGEPWLIGAADRSLTARFITHPEAGTVRREGLIVADPATTVVDLLRFLPRADAARVGRAALQQRTVSVQDLELARVALSRLKGVLQLWDVICELREGTHAESEHELVSLVRSAGIRGWEANHPVRVDGRRYFIDLAFPDAKLAVEVDGRAHHSTDAAFRADRRRQNDLSRAGWQVLRFTWDDLVGDPAYVIARIVEALGLQG